MSIFKNYYAKEWRVLANKAKNIVDKLLSNRNIDYKDKKRASAFLIQIMIAIRMILLMKGNKRL